MSEVEMRKNSRDSVSLFARLRVNGSQQSIRVQTRNLSTSGMMAEGEAEVTRGTPVAVELHNIGWVKGAVAWKQGDRFGIAFVDEIDPQAVRAADGAGGGGPDEGTTVSRDEKSPVTRLHEI